MYTQLEMFCIWGGSALAVGLPREGVPRAWEKGLAVLYLSQDHNLDVLRQPETYTRGLGRVQHLVVKECTIANREQEALATLIASMPALQSIAWCIVANRVGR